MCRSVHYTPNCNETRKPLLLPGTDIDEKLYTYVQTSANTPGMLAKACWTRLCCTPLQTPCRVCGIILAESRCCERYNANSLRRAQGFIARRCDRLNFVNRSRDMGRSKTFQGALLQHEPFFGSQTVWQQQNNPRGPLETLLEV